MAEAEPDPVQVIRDAAWSASHAVDELREAYFVMGAAVDRLARAAAGSSHPLPTRATRCWGDALALTNDVIKALTAGIGRVLQVPEVSSPGSTGDVVDAVDAAQASMRGVANALAGLRDRVDRTRAHLLVSGIDTPNIHAADQQWQVAADRLDTLLARLQVGGAAATAYTEGLSGVDLAQRGQIRLARLVPLVRGSADTVLAGALTAGRLIAMAQFDQRTCPAPVTRLPVWRQRLTWFADNQGWRAAVRRSNHLNQDGVDGLACAKTLFRLCEGDIRGYRRWLDLLVRRKRSHRYAEFLAAAFVLAVDRRFPARRDPATLDRFLTRVRQRYSGAWIDPFVADDLIRTALGDRRMRPIDAAQSIAVVTVLVIALLADEGGDRRAVDDFLAEAGRMLPGGDLNVTA
ncbi:hypothetical protein ACWDV4_22655 [Micromonospora sp. NPDC003197]